jgi:hypothetical protein
MTELFPLPPPALGHVGHVFFAAGPAQMARAHTDRIVTTVRGLGPVLWGRTVRHFAHQIAGRAAGHRSIARFLPAIGPGQAGIAVMLQRLLKEPQMLAPASIAGSRIAVPSPALPMLLAQAASVYRTAAERAGSDAGIPSGSKDRHGIAIRAPTHVMLLAKAATEICAGTVLDRASRHPATVPQKAAMG